jgi:type II secretory pathway component GspD/PulD (secretin)
MASRSRTYGAFAVSALLAAAITALLAPKPLNERMDTAVKAALDSQGRVQEFAQFQKVVRDAQALTDIRVEQDGTVSLVTTGESEYRSATRDNGQTYVIDLYDTVNVVPSRVRLGDSQSPIRAIRSTLHQIEPRLVSRVVLEVAPDTRVALRQDAGMITASLTGGAAAPAQHMVHAAVQRHGRDFALLAQNIRDQRDQTLALSPMPRYAVAFGYGKLLADASQSWNALSNDWQTNPSAINREEAFAAQWGLCEAVIRSHSDSLRSVCISRDSTPATTLAALDEAVTSYRSQLTLHDNNSLALAAVLGKAHRAGSGVAEAVQTTGEAVAHLAAHLTGAFSMTFAQNQVAMAKLSNAYAEQLAVRANTLTNADADAFLASGETVITQASRTASPRFAQVNSDPRDFVLSPVASRWAAMADTHTVEAETVTFDEGNVTLAQAEGPAINAMAPRPAEGEGRVAQITTVRPAGDPLDQLVDIDFREMELSNAVAILARKAQVNVVAGPPLTGTITASLKNVPLRKAMEILLELNDLGIIEDEGILRIVPLQDAAASNRITQTVYLDNANATDLATTLQNVVSAAPGSELVSISPNDNTNILVVAGPPNRVRELTALAQELDIAEPVLPTFTEAIPLNYAEPEEIRPVVESMLTAEIGKVEVDGRSRHIIVKDVPAVIEQIRAMILKVDQPVKQVAIHAMLVDAVLRDSSELGASWLLELFPDLNRRGMPIGDFTGGSFEGNLGNVGSTDLNAGILSFGLLNRDYGLQARIAAEAASGNTEILANPMVITTENKEANITIAQEFPYQEITQGLTGPPVATTNFKDIGITLTVMPRVTHDNHIIVDLDAKQSSVSGLTETGVPIEDKREATTTLTVADGQTIFIGGLRNVSDRLDTNKIPVLGDIPVLGFMFKNTAAEKIHTELMIFLTTHVIENDLPELTPAEQAAHDKLGGVPYVPDAQRAMFRNIGKPGESRDPAWKWRRSK